MRSADSRRDNARRPKLRSTSLAKLAQEAGMIMRWNQILHSICIFLLVIFTMHPVNAQDQQSAPPSPEGQNAVPLQPVAQETSPEPSAPVQADGAGATITNDSIPQSQEVQTPSAARESVPQKTSSPLAEASGAESSPAMQEQQEQESLDGIAAARALIQRRNAPAKPSTLEETSLPGNKLILPEDKISPIIDKYALLSAGYLTDEQGEDIIVGGADAEKTTYAFGDIVYVRTSVETVNVGDKFLISSPLEIIKHPVTGDRYGITYGVGILQIVEKAAEEEDVHTAKITLSFNAFGKNAVVTPYQEPSLAYQPAASAEKRAKDITGYVVALADKLNIVGQTHFVYLDKGSADGIEPADRFNVFAEPSKRGFPKKLIGEVQVILVKDQTATAVVRRSAEPLEKGNLFIYKK